MKAAPSKVPVKRRKIGVERLRRLSPPPVGRRDTFIQIHARQPRRDNTLESRLYAIGSTARQPSAGGLPTRRRIPSWIPSCPTKRRLSSPPPVRPPHIRNRLTICPQGFVLTRPSVMAPVPTAPCRSRWSGRPTYP